MQPSLLKRFSSWSISPTGTAVHALGITQIVAWGTTLYALGVLGRPITTDTGWSTTVVFGGLTVGLLVAGLTSTWIGRLIDKRGARATMTIGAVLNAICLAALSLVSDPIAYLAVWALLGIAMRLTLYDAAFAALVQVTPQNGRRAISYLTLYGGLASTLFWPLGYYLNDAFGWRETCLIFGLFNLFACAPLNWWGLARNEPAPDLLDKAAPENQSKELGIVTQPPLEGRARLMAIVLFSIATSAYAFIFGAASVHLVGVIEASGITAALAVQVASIKGVAQVGGRAWEIIFARNMTPINLARVPVWLMPVALAVLLTFSAGLVPALLFTVLFGAANGLITIVRGALPLAMFGIKGYGEILGVLATPYLLINALSPAVFAIVIDWGGYLAGQWLLLAAALLSVAAMETMTAWYRGHNANSDPKQPR